MVLYPFCNDTAQEEICMLYVVKEKVLCVKVKVLSLCLTFYCLSCGVLTLSLFICVQSFYAVTRKVIQFKRHFVVKQVLFFFLHLWIIRHGSGTCCQKKWKGFNLHVKSWPQKFQLHICDHFNNN